MKRQTFDSLDYATLIQAAIEPTLQQLHELNPAVKSQVYAQLTSGQLALVMFRALHDHAGTSAGDFYWWISYLLTESRRWSGIKGGLRYFGDDAMLHLLEETERFLTARKQQEDAGQRPMPSWDLGNDPEFAASVDQLNATFHQTATETLKLIGAYIRNHPGEFVQIEG